MNILLDTCVFIDYLGRKEPFFEPAAQVIAAGYFGDASLWVSAQSLKDSSYVLSKYVDSQKVQRAMKEVCKVVKIIDLTAEDSLRALDLEWQDYEDCLEAIAADKAKCDFLITRDAKGFSRSMVKPLSPSEWLERMRTERGFEYGSIALS